jgi:membrane-bound lytic murein transglycosylase B
MAGFGRAQKASALLPLAVLSVAWTAGLATAGTGSSSAPGQLPDGTRIPSHTIKGPASLTKPSRLGLHGLDRRHSRPTTLVAGASATGIPAVALAAYQRAQTVINAADSSCHLPWQLVAAIGRVESDHGRAQGNTLTNKGIDVPGIYGPVLDGRNGTARITDTDGGQYDHNTRFDRAVGPMQFIPSTWAIVGVDGDNDGQRNPQDIYDASLAAAVYLCAGNRNLATPTGMRAAVLSYNHSASYVALVMAIERAYLNGNYTSVPNGTTTTGYSFDMLPAAAPVRHLHGHHARPAHERRGRHRSTTKPGTGNVATPGPTAGPTARPTSSPSVNPTKAPTALPTHLPTSQLSSAAPSVLSHAKAVAVCTARGLVDNPLDPNDAFDRCVYNLTH